MQESRRRRHHRRSRNGCTTCKRRHIRCDELKPFCRNCLSNGGVCGYPNQGSSGLDLTTNVNTAQVLWCTCPTRHDVHHEVQHTEYAHQSLEEVAPGFIDPKDAFLPIQLSMGPNEGGDTELELAASSNNFTFGIQPYSNQVDLPTCFTSSADTNMMVAAQAGIASLDNMLQSITYHPGDPFNTILADGSSSEMIENDGGPLTISAYQRYFVCSDCGGMKDVYSPGGSMCPEKGQSFHMQEKQLLRGFTSPFGAGTSDPFQTLPIYMSRASNLILDHFQNYHVLVPFPVRRSAAGPMFPFAVSDPVLTHVCLLLGASHFVFMGGSSDMVATAFYHHKVQAIRLVNERLGDPSMALLDGTVGAVACLTILESMRGSVETAVLHLNGLEQLVKMRGDLHTDRMSSILSRAILLADTLTSSAAKTQPRFLQSESSEDGPPGHFRPDPAPNNDDEVMMMSVSKEAQLTVSDTPPEVGLSCGLDADLSKMFTELYRLSRRVAISSTVKPGSQVDETLSADIGECEKFIDNMIHNPGRQETQIGGELSNDGACCVCGYLYLYFFLRRIPVTSSVFDYMAWLIKECFGRARPKFRVLYPPELLFWILFVGASAALGRPHEAWYLTQLSISRRELKLTSVEDARRVLEKFSWVEARCETYSSTVWDKLDMAG